MVIIENIIYYLVNTYT